VPKTATVTEQIPAGIESDNTLETSDGLAAGGMDYAIYSLDLDGNVKSWNERAQRIKGYSAQEIIGSNFSVFYTDDDVRAEVPARSLEIARAEGRFEAEGWRVRKDGTRLWANVVIDVLQSPAGEVIGFANITRDLTQSAALGRATAESGSIAQMLVDNVVDYAIYLLDLKGTVKSGTPARDA
jgi:PAS domain S-box-containing protein